MGEMDYNIRCDRIIVAMEGAAICFKVERRKEKWMRRMNVGFVCVQLTATLFRKSFD